MENEIKTKTIDIDIDIKKVFSDFCAAYSYHPKNREEYFQKFEDLIDYVFKGSEEIYVSDLGKRISMAKFKELMLHQLKKMLKERNKI